MTPYTYGTESEPGLLRSGVVHHTLGPSCTDRVSIVFRPGMRVGNLGGVKRGDYEGEEYEGRQD